MFEKFNESLHELDTIHLNFSAEGMFFINIALAFIMFGIALDIKPSSFKKLFLRPKPAIVGIISQFILLPALTYLAIVLIKPTLAVALGMILVAACPGGNISNFISSLAKGNIELSISLTAFATTAALVMTPINFVFWGNLYVSSLPLVKPIEIPLSMVVRTVVILLGLPLTAGLFFAYKFPKTTAVIIKPIKIASLFAFGGMVVGALAANFEHFMSYVWLIFPIVLFHNVLALSSGYVFAWITGLKQNNRRTIAIETGIQNSGLALVLIFGNKIFPDGMGGIAFIAAWWGIWHIISGLFIAFLWSRKPPVN